MSLLRGKKALVTGANRGIGLAIAHKFAQQGAELWLNGLDSNKIEDVRSEIVSKYATDCHALCFDVSDPLAVKAGFQHLFKQTKTLDVLVNNAGIMDDALLGMVTHQQLERSFSTNTYSVIYCTQYAARLMERAGSGAVVNIASIMGRVGNAGQSVYAGSKAAVIGITQSLAKELASKQIRVNAIAPGFIETDLVKILNENTYESRLQSIAIGRAGLASEVADVAAFLASNMASYVTGQVIGVDGGMLI